MLPLLLALVAAVVHAVPLDCDCGVQVINYGAPAAAPSQPDELSPSVNLDTRLTLIPMGTTGPGSGYDWPVLFASQARAKCYRDYPTTCSGWILSDGGMTGYLSARFFTYARSLGTGGLAATTGLEDIDLSAATLWVIKRFEHYDCPSYTTFDPYFVYFGSTDRRNRIESSIYCPYLNATSGRCCWQNDVASTNCTTLPTPTLSQANAESTQKWRSAAQLYWNTTGFMMRDPPNPSCALTPTLWTAASQCALPQTGCFALNQVPCGGRGVCSVNVNNPLYSTPYYCSCAHFAGGLFDNVAKYMGRACEFSTRDGCTPTSNAAEMCSGYNTRCKELLIANTAPNNNYLPKCDCDSNPPIPGSGPFCEINRCDLEFSCRKNGVAGGTCAYHAGVSPPWFCDCGLEGVGPTCQYTTTTCRANGGSAGSLCSTNGVCQPPYLNDSVSVGNPNYSFNSAWCGCQPLSGSQQNSFGQYCQSLSCNPSVVTPNRGQCNPVSGALVGCYAPYETSGPNAALKCDVDRCAATGGVVVPGSPPTTCNCGVYLTGSQLSPPQSDISCFPRCPVLNGVVCGPAVSPAVNVCNQIPNYNGSRAAVCMCDSRYIQVPAPASENTFLGMRAGPAGHVVCEKYCIHGSQTNVGTCDCSNSGYSNRIDELGVAHLRCDNPVCKNSGVYNSGTGRCACVGPFTSANVATCAVSALGCCTVQTCDVPTSLFVEGFVDLDPGNSARKVCSCNPPFAHITSNDAADWTDCSRDNCGSHGAVNSAVILSRLNSAVTQYEMCRCDSGWKTVCSDTSGATCAFCSAVDTCAPHGAYNYTTSLCTCAGGWTGTLCDVPPVVPASSSSSSSSSTGGVASSSSSSSSSTGANATNANNSSSSSTGVFETSSAASARTNVTIGLSSILFLLVYLFF